MSLFLHFNIADPWVTWQPPPPPRHPSLQWFYYFIRTRITWLASNLHATVQLFHNQNVQWEKKNESFPQMFQLVMASIFLFGWNIFIIGVIEYARRRRRRRLTRTFYNVTCPTWPLGKRQLPPPPIPQLAEDMKCFQWERGVVKQSGHCFGPISTGCLYL